MSSDEGPEFTLPSIPYFYHDIVARIIPGMIQLGLTVGLAAYYSPEWAKSQIPNLKSVLDTAQFAAVLLLLSAAYFVGVFFEGCRVFGLGKLYRVAFARELKRLRLRFNVPGDLGQEETDRLADESSAILESYEPFVPHFFARSTRFLGEAKMMLYSALAMPMAVVVVGAATGRWLPPGGYTRIACGLALFAVLIIVALSRQGRRAVEILRCVQYLALRTDQVDRKRALDAWTRLLASSSPTSNVKKNSCA